MSEGDWFAPKRFGYGAGLPIAWQGWVLIGAYMAAVLVAAVMLGQHHPILLLAIVAVLTIPLVIVSAQHTRGSWQWRWGGED